LFILQYLKMRIRHHVNPFSVLKKVSFAGFGNSNPIIVDVGSCYGEFVEKLAEKFPGKNFLALEIREKLIQMLEKKFSEQENIQVLNGDAGKNWTNIIKPCQEQGAIIENVFINFPDPWFKVKHHKRRFVSESFLQSASEIFDEKTTFYFQTDQKELFDDTLEIVQNSVFNKITFFENSPWGITTDWEEAKMRENAPIFRMKFSK